MAHPSQLDILRQVREEVGLTQDDMARLCGLRGQQSRQTAGAWERGDIVPSRARRSRFIGYLWDHLRLRKDPTRFEAVWEILMAHWGWEPISGQEWVGFTAQERPRRDKDIDQKLEQLAARLGQIQSSMGDLPSLPWATTSSTNPGPQVDSRLQTVVKLPLDALPDPAPLPARSRMPLARNPLFVGRQQELMALAAAFSTHSITAINQVETAAATGSGGIGKTQLASEFAHRYGQYFRGGVFWLSFDNAEAVSSEIAACGGAGALELRPDFATRNLEEQVRIVQAAFQEPEPRLLVFDNCEDPALLTRWRPTSGGCRVSVTSRSLEWDLALGVHVHALDVLNREESLQLLQKHKLNVTLDLLDAIAAELGDLPLALHLAGSYLHRYRRVLTAEQYLAYLRDPALLAHPSLQGAGTSPTGHIQHVARTFALSYDRLDSSYELDARARQILVHMALLAPGEPVPYTLLAQTLNTDLDDPQQAVTMEAAVMRLLELGLLDVHLDVHEENQLRVHRLLATFVRGSALDLSQGAQTRVEATIQHILDQNHQSVTPLNLLPIQVHLSHVVEAALVRHDVPSALLGNALARHLWGLGEYSHALMYTKRSLAIHEGIARGNHADGADTYHLMGILLHETNEFEQAHQHLQRALDIRLKLVGENHFDTADTLVNIGGLLWSEQRNQEAIACLERALHICDEAVEEDHPLVAEITMTLGLCMLDGGYDSKQALYYMEEALRIRRQRLGEEHAYTALAYTNMGYLLHQIGELEAAGWNYQQGLAIRQRVLGEKHVDSANSLYCLGRLRRMQERWDEAQQYLEQALTIFLEGQGEAYALTASCLNELGAVLLGKHEIARARHYLEQALALRHKIYQPTHPFIANTLQNLGLALLAQAEISAAEQILRQVLRTRQQATESENLPVAETLDALGQVAESCHDLDQARQCYGHSVTIYARLLGIENVLTQRVAHRLERLGTKCEESLLPNTS